MNIRGQKNWFLLLRISWITYFLNCKVEIDFEIFVIYLQILQDWLSLKYLGFQIYKSEKSFDDNDVDEIKLKENCALVQIKDIDF